MPYDLCTPLIVETMIALAATWVATISRPYSVGWTFSALYTWMGTALWTIYQITVDRQSLSRDTLDNALLLTGAAFNLTGAAFAFDASARRGHHDQRDWEHLL
jgi:hypothetical protein